MHKIYETKHKRSSLQQLTPAGSELRLLNAKLQRKENSSKILANLTQPWQKQNNLLSLRGWQAVSFNQGDKIWWIMVIVLVSTYSQNKKPKGVPSNRCFSRPRNQRFGYLSEQYWRIQAQNSKIHAQRYPLTAYHNFQVDKRYSQHHTHPLSCSTRGGGGGVAME